MKLNKTNLIWAFLLPGLVIASLFITDRILQTGLLLFPLLLVYFEHLLIGWLFSFDLGRDSGGGFISLPLNIPVLTATAILDYLLVAFVVYILLTILTKYVFPDRNLR